MEEVWIVKGIDKKYSDEELVKLIKQGILGADDYIATKELNKWVKISDSIYQYYLKEALNETL